MRYFCLAATFDIPEISVLLRKGFNELMSSFILETFIKLYFKYWKTIFWKISYKNNETDKHCPEHYSPVVGNR